MKRIIFIFLIFFSIHVSAAPVYVSTDWLSQNLNNKKVVIVDMSESELQYARFHIPGAIRLSYYALVKRPKKSKFPIGINKKELVRLLGQLGIDRNSHVVIYDDTGGLHTGRLFWYLERIKHPDVSVVDGGLVRWILNGHKVVNTPTKLLPVAYKLPSVKLKNNEAAITEVMRASRYKKTQLLDVRSREEYVGDMRKRRGGHIPNARWWEWDKSLSVAAGFVRRDKGQLMASLKKIGVGNISKPVITYCRSGHRAAQSYLVLRSLGFTNVKLYSRSMNEYGSIRTAPLQQGILP